mgnify:CR=1 FL=1
MLADPQTLTVNTVAKTLAAVERGKLASKYREDTGEHELVISTTEGKRDRSVIRVNHTTTAADPLTAETAEVGASVYLVIDRHKFGYTNAELDYLAQALFGLCTTSLITSVLGGES